jgi:hypothetical protein
VSLVASLVVPLIAAMIVAPAIDERKVNPFEQKKCGVQYMVDATTVPWAQVTVNLLR